MEKSPTNNRREKILLCFGDGLRVRENNKTNNKSSPVEAIAEAVQTPS